MRRLASGPLGMRSFRLAADAGRCGLVAALAVLAARPTASLAGQRADPRPPRSAGSAEMIRRRARRCLD